MSPCSVVPHSHPFPIASCFPSFGCVSDGTQLSEFFPAQVHHCIISCGLVEMLLIRLSCSLAAHGCRGAKFIIFLLSVDYPTPSWYSLLLIQKASFRLISPPLNVRGCWAADLPVCSVAGRWRLNTLKGHCNHDKSGYLCMKGWKQRSQKRRLNASGRLKSIEDGDLKAVVVIMNIISSLSVEVLGLALLCSFGRDSCSVLQDSKSLADDLPSFFWFFAFFFSCFL